MTEIKIPTDAEARATVEARWQAAREEALAYAAKRIVREAENAARAAERDAARQKAHEEQRAKAIADARKAHRTLYGRALARRIDPERRYWIVRAGRESFAFSDPTAAGEARRLLGGTIIGAGGRGVPHVQSAVGRSALETDRGIVGVHLGQHAKALADVDAPTEKLAKLVAERGAKRDADQRARNERRAAERQRERELATYGAAVGGEADED